MRDASEKYLTLDILCNVMFPLITFLSISERNNNLYIFFSLGPFVSFLFPIYFCEAMPVYANSCLM